MSFLGKNRIDQDARREALAGVNSVDDHITRRLGPRPRDFDPVGNHEHGQVATALGRRAEISDWTDDLRRAESEASRHPNPTGLSVGIVFCFLVEVLGGVLVMRAVGVGEERLPLGIALGLALIGITAVTSNRTAMGAESNGETGAPRRRNTTALILTVYSALVLALAVVRLRLGAEEGGALEALPETVVMIATTIGPAWLAEHFLRRRRPAAIVAAEVRRLKRRIRDAERESATATAFMTRLARGQTAWDDQAARLRASFESVHRLTRAEQGQLAQEPNPNERR